jgi:NADH-quinone oxidoreductase subunit L
VAAVGMGAFTAGMFHLVTHAFFKALLFLSAGSVIQGMEHAHTVNHHNRSQTEEIDPQDMRNMGGLRTRMKTTFVVYLAGALALAGIAPLAGFFSKDEILAFAYQNSPVVFILLILAALLTAFYMGRQIWMVFFGEPRSEAARRAGENPPIMTTPLIILAVLSVIGGGFNLPGVESLAKWLKHTITSAQPGEFVVLVAVVSLGIALLSILLAWLVYGKNPMKAGDPDPLKKMLGPLFTPLEHRWWVDEAYAWLILNPYKAVSRFLAEPVDQGLIDGIVNGLGSLTVATSGVLRKLQNGLTANYALIMVIGMAAIFTYLFLR